MGQNQLVKISLRRNCNCLKLCAFEIRMSLIEKNYPAINKLSLISDTIQFFCESLSITFFQKMNLNSQLIFEVSEGIA